MVVGMGMGMGKMNARAKSGAHGEGSCRRETVKEEVIADSQAAHLQLCYPKLPTFNFNAFLSISIFQMDGAWVFVSAVLDKKKGYYYLHPHFS